MSSKAKVSGSVVAGFPSPTEQYQEPPLDLNELLVKRPADTYFVRVDGDSMIGAGISDGDLLVVERSLRPAGGAGCRRAGRCGTLAGKSTLRFFSEKWVVHNRIT